jgi:hypothetical protein
MKEKIQAKIYEETKDMTFPELDVYFNKSLENSVFWQGLVYNTNVHKRMELT